MQRVEKLAGGLAEIKKLSTEDHHGDDRLRAITPRRVLDEHRRK